jgi:diguanylate cyclase (GGDEF)-like protein
MSSRLLAVAGRLLTPSAALVGRLRYAHKFAVVGMVLLVPLGFITWSYVDLQRTQIAFSAKEREGVALMAPVVELMADTVQARHRAVTAPGQPPAELVADLGRVDALDRRVGGSLGTSQQWRTVRATVVAAQLAAGSPASRYAAYNAASDALLEFIVRVGDVSNLTLDPDLDTYYLMDTLQFRLPVLLDTAGRSVDRAILSANEPPGPDVYIELGLDNGVLSSTRRVITRAIHTVAENTASSRVRASSVAKYTRLDAAAQTLGELLTTAVRDRRAAAIAADAADTVRAEARRFGAATAGSLDDLLRTRISGFSARADRVEIGSGLAGLLAVYLFGGFYLSVVPPLRRIVAALHAVGDGDLTQRVRVDTHDELSFVATALNDTVATTKTATDRLAEQATHDSLTGLPNRALAVDRLAEALARTRRREQLMAVLFIDLDRFKIINDSLGHEAGDEVLCAVAGRLTSLVPAGDTVARLAGDEFVVVVENTPGDLAVVPMAERIVDSLSQPIVIRPSGAERDVTVGASVGIAFADAASTIGPDELLRNADVAMYRAKQRGRGRVEIFDDTLRVAVQQRLETQHDLRHAIETGQVYPHYQPIVDADRGVVVGFEALARWDHPAKGRLPAGAFIGVAADSGLIVPLGAAILAQACAQTARWHAEHPARHPLRIAVNVSAEQFNHPSLVPTVADVLAETGLDPDALWLEITETSLMADAQAATDTLHAIRALGVHLAIDDFGTGYSSLAYLRRFPVEALKIDRSFVSGLGRDHEDDAIVAMIVGLARNLELRLVAEGVETPAQLGQLANLGCTTIQGFYFSRPVAAAQVWEVISTVERLAADTSVRVPATA